MAVYLSALMLDMPATSRASPLPQDFGLAMEVVNDTNPLWELACRRRLIISHHWCWMCRPHR